MPVFLHGSEEWTTVEKHKSKITSWEMRFLGKIENKIRRDHIKKNTFWVNVNINAADFSDIRRIIEVAGLPLKNEPRKNNNENIWSKKYRPI